MRVVLRNSGTHCQSGTAASPLKMLSKPSIFLLLMKRGHYFGKIARLF